MRNIILALSFASLLVILAIGTLSQKDFEPTLLMKLREKYSKEDRPSVDHSRLPSLQKAFSSPQEITKACISCHNMTTKDIMAGNHWNWEREEYIEGRGIIYLGKKNALNNFCIGTKGNEKSCAKCHIGYGMDSQGTVYVDSLNIDCLVCHDNSETYVKATEKAGMPDPSLDFNLIAEHVGKPLRTNCGVCHFYGGGGNNVKHGDLEASMFYPSREIDVHMASDGMNLQCIDCHTTNHHNISGKVYSLSSMNLNRNTCEQCHTEQPHEDNLINEHALKVSCQACHIPVYAKENATKMNWDWSTAGRLRNGEPFFEEDSMGNHSYLSIKGSFVWEKNVIPEYVWFNGTASHYLKGDIIEDTTGTVCMNRLNGSYADDEAKIVPVKIHRARQPYDPVNQMLIIPKLYADNKGEGAFWKDFNWQAASKQGMIESGLPFSGEIEFIKTGMMWPLNHMVSTKEKTLECRGCHNRETSRLAGLTDFYLPGRDHPATIDFIGKWIILLTIFGLLMHTIIRIWSYRKLTSRTTNE